MYVTYIDFTAASSGHIYVKGYIYQCAKQQGIKVTSDSLLIHELIIHCSLFGYLLHDLLLPFVSFDKTHSLRCISKRWCCEW